MLEKHVCLVRLSLWLTILVFPGMEPLPHKGKNGQFICLIRLSLWLTILVCPEMQPLPHKGNNEQVNKSYSLSSYLRNMDIRTELQKSYNQDTVESL